jgi:hypothetical protein
MTELIVVKAALDPEAGVWLTKSSDVRGLRIKAPTLNALAERVRRTMQDFLKEDDLQAGSAIQFRILVDPNKA